MASFLQIVGLIGLVVGVFLILGVGFAVLSGAAAVFVVGYSMERAGLRPPGDS